MPSCQECGAEDSPVSAGVRVAERGRVNPLCWLCDRCWAVAVNDAAHADGAVWRPEDDPDDYQLREPPVCGDCGGEVVFYRTNYDRWIALEAEEMPAKDVPSRYRWQVHTYRARYSTVVVEVIAQRLAGTEPPPGQLVRPAHRFRCPSPDAKAEVRGVRAYDRLRAQQRLESPVDGTVGDSEAN